MCLLADFQLIGLVFCLFLFYQCIQYFEYMQWQGQGSDYNIASPKVYSMTINNLFLL